MSSLRLFWPSVLPYPFIPLLLIAILSNHFCAISAINNSSSSPTTQTTLGCPVSDLQQCAEPLRTMGVPLSKNLVRLLLQIPSPYQLTKSCRAYHSVMPCFHYKVAECGSSGQREILRQLANALQFLCSPFSSLQQSQLLAHRVCIGRVLGQSQPDGECHESRDGRGIHPTSKILHKCRAECLTKGGTTKFACLIRTWLSEQNLCLLARMRMECGKEAAAFYTQMQRQIFHPEFPLICAADGDKEKFGKMEGGDKVESSGNADSFQQNSISTIVANSIPSSSSTPPSIFVTGKKKRTKTVAKLSEFNQIKLAKKSGTEKMTKMPTTLPPPTTTKTSKTTTTTLSSSLATSSMTKEAKMTKEHRNMNKSQSNQMMTRRQINANGSPTGVTKSTTKQFKISSNNSLPSPSPTPPPFSFITAIQPFPTPSIFQSPYIPSHSIPSPTSPSPSPPPPPQSPSFPLAKIPKKKKSSSRVSSPSSSMANNGNTVAMTRNGVKLLVQSVPFMLVPSSALSQISNQPPSASQALVHPAWDGMGRLQHHSFLAGSRLLFFEVAPIDEITAQLQQGFNGKT